ncbi:MAG: hypothetical protein ACREBJ_05900 [Nitrosotalea sp.]
MNIGIDVNNLVLILAIVVAILSSIVFLAIFYIKIRRNNPERFNLVINGGKRIDFDLIQSCIIKALILGVSIFAAINTTYYGVTEIWLLPYSYDLGRIGLVVGGILFIFFSIKEVYNFMKDKEAEGIVTPKKANSRGAKKGK